MIKKQKKLHMMAKILKRMSIDKTNFIIFFCSKMYKKEGTRQNII
jgi:hypothetical protein